MRVQKKLIKAVRFLCICSAYMYAKRHGEAFLRAACFPIPILYSVRGSTLLSSIVNDINFRTLMSEVCCYADELFYLKVQILMSFTIYIREIRLQSLHDPPYIVSDDTLLPAYFIV